MAKTEYFDPERVAELAHECNGNMSAVARELGCSAETIRGYKERHQVVAEAIQAAKTSAYSRMVDDLVAVALGEDKDSDIDRQYALDKMTKVFGEAVKDDLNFVPRQRVEHVENLGITILPSDGTPVRDSNTAQALQDGAVRDVLPADTQG